MANIARLRVASELPSIPEESQFISLVPRSLIKIFPKGIARGSIAEIYGPRSSGRLSLCLQILAQATVQSEVCAVIDLYDSFSPVCAASAGVRLEKLVWVRSRGNAEHAIRAADLLLHAGGFGVVLLDLCEANARILNRIPLSYWYRFRRAIEHTPTILLVCADSIQARSCSNNQLQLKPNVFHWAGTALHRLLRGLEVNAILRKGTVVRPESLFLKMSA
ncbi:MAG: hypothetical protein JO033_02715 [Acidobacteriaceae bacterium]|nr:hypothetical protein [Acidobacteriaceae bacterium]MBV9499207.1 hypothetical protein [Acidobacteriaceae bacterium]